jgi:hypothetical protein
MRLKHITSLQKETSGEEVEVGVLVAEVLEDLHHQALVEAPIAELDQAQQGPLQQEGLLLQEELIIIVAGMAMQHMVQWL